MELRSSFYFYFAVRLPSNASEGKKNLVCVRSHFFGGSCLCRLRRRLENGVGLERKEEDERDLFD